MQYIIRSFDQQNGQITVEYDGKWVYAIDLPIENGAFPVGERLEQVIQAMAPVWLVERSNALAANPANADVISALVQPFPVTETENPVIQNQLESQEQQIESDTAFITQIINDVLASKGL